MTTVSVKKFHRIVVHILAGTIESNLKSGDSFMDFLLRIRVQVYCLLQHIYERDKFIDGLSLIVMVKYFWRDFKPLFLTHYISDVASYNLLPNVCVCNC
ncbi:hypothetical protein, partial [Shewanella psychromarinicola]|uniref:hypothetical protein n=1 Tax=Shewanella psychromarinicola TaxID=2487742 RepID=UPI00200C570E